MDRITVNMLSVIESKAVSKERLDAFFREKIEMVGAKEAKTTAEEARVSLDNTFRGGEMGEVDELEDDADDGGGSRGARGLAPAKLSPKEIINNMNDCKVSCREASGTNRGHHIVGLKGTKCFQT